MNENATKAPGSQSTQAIKGIPKRVTTSAHCTERAKKHLVPSKIR
jgi:hypothetical protein